MRSPLARRPRPCSRHLMFIGLLLAFASPAQALYANKDFYWKGSPVTIPVCWEDPSAATDTRRNWVRDAVDSNWGHHGRVNFVEWDTCAAGDPGVHIRIADVRPSAPGGVTLNGMTNGATLNLSFVAFGPSWCSASEANREACVRATAVHEFGHVLGFYHEEERDDYVAPPGTMPGDPCEKQFFANSNKQYYGAYDVDSVMSYCGQPFADPSTWKVALSPGDVASLQRAYGRRIAGSLVSPAGNCMASHATGPDGESVFLWDCDEANDDQEWRRNGWGNDRLFLGYNRCLENEWWSNQSGDGAILWDCGPYATQKWQFQQVYVVGWGGLCLDLEDGSIANGTRIQMWQCGALGGANQKWTVTPSGQIKYGGPASGKCVTAVGSAVFLWDCGFPTYQQFSFLSTGRIRLKSSSTRCLDVEGWTDAEYLAGTGLPSNGQSVQVFTCLSQQRNQLWNLSGRVRHAYTGLCLDREGGSEDNGTRIQIWTCNDTGAQRWDYYLR